MFTTVGSSSLAMPAKAFDNCFGAGTWMGDASELFGSSLPFTPFDTTVPIRMPIASVTRMSKVEASRFARIWSNVARARAPISFPPNGLQPEDYNLLQHSPRAAHNSQEHTYGGL